MRYEPIETLAKLPQRIIEGEENDCLVWLEGEDKKTSSCREVANLCCRYANGLLEAGVEPGDRVAVLADNSEQTIIAALAVLTAGATLTPIDVQMADDLLQTVLADCQPRMILTTSEQLKRIQEASEEIELGIFAIDLDEDEREEGSQDEIADWKSLQSDNHDPPELHAIDPQQRAVLFYTSGTTGPPKGVPLTHENILTQFQAVAEADIIQPADRVLLPLPLHHVYPLVIGALCPLVMQLPLVIPASLTGPDILRAMRKGNPSIVIGVPRLYSALFQALQSQADEAAGRAGRAAFAGAVGLGKWIRRWLGVGASDRLFSPLHQQVAPDLRLLASGGSPLDPQLGKRLEAIGWPVTIGYGLTETSPLLTICPPESRHLDTVGKPIRDVELKIDPDVEAAQQGEAESEEHAESKENNNQPGEILARGPCVFEGYYNREEKTREAFTEDGWFRTGDLGFLDSDHRLHVTGRVSTTIITSGGEKVQPDEVEDKLEEAELVREIGVLGVDGELIAVIVPERSARSGDQWDRKAIGNSLQQTAQDLPSYQRPADFVLTDKPLPRTRLGKIRRHALEQLYDDIESGRVEQSGHQKPLSIDEMSPDDRALVQQPRAKQAWDWLVERFADQPLAPDARPEQDLGIDSLEWTNLTLEIEQKTSVELDEEAISRIATVRDLLQEIAAAEPGTADESLDPLEEPDRALDEEQRKLLGKPGRLRRSIATTGYWMNRAMVRRFLKLQVEGAEHLPDSGPLVIIANHVSHLDPAVLAASMSREMHAQTYWATWVGVTHRNFATRTFGHYAQTLNIDPKKGVLNLAAAAAVLQREQILVWFPEGQRSNDGKLQTFKTGLGKLLTHYDVPVLPAYIQGTHEAMPVGSRRPRRHPVTLRFAATVRPKQLEKEGDGDQPEARIVDALERRVRALRDKR